MSGQQQSTTQQNTYSAAYIIQALDTLIVATRKNPNHLATLASLPTITLGSPSSSGGKFWQGVITDTGLDIRFGKSGTRGSLLSITPAKCRHLNPVIELKERIMKKLHKGYTVLSYAK